MTKWWNDSQLTVMPAGGSNLSVASTIYVLLTSGIATKRIVTADKVGIVTLPGIKSQAINTTDFIYESNGYNFLWIEGEFEQDNIAGGNAIKVDNSKYMRIHNSHIIDVGTRGLNFFTVHYSKFTQLLFTNSSRPDNQTFLCNTCDYNLIEDAESNRSGQWSFTFQNSDHNFFNRIRSFDTQYSAIRLSSSSNNEIYDLVAVGGDFFGLYYSGTSTFNYAHKIRAHKMGQLIGIENSSTDNIFEDIIGFSNSVGLVFNSGNHRNVVKNFLVANTNSDGLRVSSSDNTYINGLIVYGNDKGVDISGGDRNTFLNVTTAANQWYGYEIKSTAEDTTIVNSIMANNNNVGLWNGSSPGTSLQGLFLTGNNSNPCNSDGSATSITDTTCTTDGLDGSQNWINAESTATNVKNIDLSTAFIAQITTDDSVNTHDTNGVLVHSGDNSINFWAEFETPYRGIGAEAVSGFIDFSENGRCSSGNCQIYDYAFSNITSHPMFNKTADGVNNNTPFVKGLVCPPQLDGDLVATDKQERPHTSNISGLEVIGDSNGNDDGICEPGEFCYNRFLINASEIMRDNIGDDDGLCESNESCIYSPNFGFYQGTGDYSVNECLFQNGGASGVTNIRMYAYPTNDQNFGLPPNF